MNSQIADNKIVRYRQLSSPSTNFFKKLFPGAFIVMTLLFWFAKPSNGEEIPIYYKIFFSLAAIYVIWSCSKLRNVQISNKDIIVSAGKKSQQLPYTEISHVTSLPLGNFRPVWIHLNEPSEFGIKIMFVSRYNLFNIGSVSEAETLSKLVKKKKEMG